MAYFGVTASAAGLQAAAPGEDLGGRAPPPAARRRRRRARRRAGPRLQVPSRRPRRRPAPLALRAPPGRRRPAHPQLARGPRLPRRRRRERPLRRLRLAGQRADARRASSPPGAPASPASTIAPPATARGWPSSWRSCSGWRRGGRSTCSPIPSARGWRSPRCRHLDERAGAGDPARRRRVRRPGAGLPRAPAGRRPCRRSTTSPPAPTTSTTSPSRPSPRAAPAASGRWGSGSARRCRNWLDLQLDRAEVTAWVNGLGIPLTAASARLCHWGFYTRGGALAVYEAILRRRPGWDIASLRAAPCFAEQEPRWSRLLPRRPAPPRPPRGIGESLTRA